MENQRIRITKKMLKNALMDLLENQPIGKVTVYSLCEKAEINRTTFYKYYGSPYELLDEIETDYFRELEHCLTENNEEGSNGLVSALCFLEGERKNWRVLINTVHDEEFAQRLFDLPVIRRLLDHYIGNAQKEGQRDYIRLFICHGGYAIIRQWLKKDNGESPEEIADLIFTLVKNTIQATE
ncbi:MAG: TetR-like C-terminal domain-containing protein [Lachnospiraceae bacterium]|nr:TetR-like C-terminal domain-containing protein [Lachnospiraceae bacterium]